LLKTVVEGDVVAAERRVELPDADSRTVVERGMD